MGTIPTNTSYKEIISLYHFDGETPRSGLLSQSFVATAMREDAIQTDGYTFSATEIPNSGRYITSSSFANEGNWTLFIDVVVTGEVIETHQISVRVSDSQSQISVQSKGSSLGNVGTLNFAGDVSITEDSGVATISIQASNPAPTGTPNSSEIPATINGTTGTLTFSARST